MSKSLSDTRNEYSKANLDESDIDPDPVVFFQHWYDQAVAARVYEPNAFVLSTIGLDQYPDARVLLLKGIDKGRFVFYTNLESEKSQEIQKSSGVSMLFFWPELERQVRIQGKAILLSDARAEAYFTTRPRNSQLGAWASMQSTIVQSREVLEKRYTEYEEKFAGKPIPKPDYWGGYEVSVHRMEFWQGRESRLHDRIVYSKSDSGTWETARLCP